MGSPHAKLVDNPYIKDALELFPHQYDGVLEVCKASRLVLGDATGLGKTIEALTAFAYYKMLSPDTKVFLLVVCPGLAILQWMKETEKYFTFSCGKITSDSFSTSKKRKEAYSERIKSNDIVFMPYSLLRIVDTKKSKGDWSYLESALMHKRSEGYNIMVVFDEADAFKSHMTKTYRTAKKLSASADKVLSMTATVIRNTLVDARNLFNVTDERYFPSVMKFRDDFLIQKKITSRTKKDKRGRPLVYYETLGEKNLDVFREFIKDIYFYREKSVSEKDLPSLCFTDYSLSMSSEVANVYNYIMSVKQFPPTLKYLFAITLSCMPIHTHADLLSFVDNHPGFDVEDIDDVEDAEDKKTDPVIGQFLVPFEYPSFITTKVYEGMRPESNFVPAKAAFLLKMLQNSTTKVVVFAGFRFIVDYLHYFLSQHGYTFGKDFFRITGRDIYTDGEMTDREYGRIQFQESDSARVILINTAGEAALNMQAGATMFLYTVPTVAGQYTQLEGRVHRLGSKHSEVNIVCPMVVGSSDIPTVDVARYGVLQRGLEMVKNATGLGTGVGTSEAKAMADVLQQMGLVSDV